MIKITSISSTMFSLLALAATSLLLPSQASGQAKLESYLRKADLDSDGRIEPHEMTMPIKRYMLSKGYDINERHKIQDVVQATTKKPVTEPSASKLKVPKFGVETTSGTGVSSFSAPVETVKYSEAVTKRARETIETYDRNGNGILDEGEIARMSWRRPRPSTSDTNGDGRLTFTELQGRFHDREVAEQRSQPSSRDSGQTDGSERGGENRFGRGRFGSRSGGSNRDSDSSRESSSSGSGRGQTSSFDQSAYVQGYFKSRDKNNNGVLEGDELKTIGTRSRAKYDTNGDGKIERNEMQAVIDEQSTGKKTTTASASSARRKYTKTSRSSSKNKLDTNGDGVIQMHEFAKEWTQKKLDEFTAKDKNGDGVLSPDLGER